ncbi:uncharacterized protein LOC126738936 isoform X2 [Anthonomus grandis grandis]|nr:uncharacterized protein LOC126738936 isoform X2 [Anthonomus grandis grandis]
MATKSHFFHGCRLLVKHKKKRDLHPTGNFSEDQFDEKMYKQIIDELKEINNFDHECLLLVGRLQPDQNDSARKCNTICQDLYNTLHERYYNIRIHPFGSTLTGLGFKNSDVDVYLSNVTDDDKDGVEVNHLNVIKRLLVKSYKFINCFVIATAKIPIIKCVHKATGIKCDININNILGVCNTKLIHYYLSLNNKLRQAMIILKYWGKHHKITGQNHLFTNYSLALMFIFFLQQEPYKFPSVFSLQQFGCQQYPNIQGVWNGEFVPNYKFYSDKLSYTSLLELVEQFFSYYLQFCYKTLIICPYLGKPLPKTYFAEPANLPYSYERYKRYVLSDDPENSSKKRLKADSAICLQDPFEHYRNTTAVIDSVLDKFVDFCKLGKTICEGRKNVLYKLLTEQPPNSKRPKIYSEEDLLRLSLHKIGNHCSEQEWFNRVVNFITIVLTDFLLFMTLNKIEETSTSEDTKNGNQSDMGGLRKISFTYGGRIDMWNARKATAKQLKLGNLSNNLIEREMAITNHLKEVYKNFQNNEFIISFDLTIEQCKDAEVLIQVRKISAYKKSFKSFAMFLSANVPLWFEIYEKDLRKATATN